MNNIENQMEQLGRIYQQTKCPKSQTEIDKAIEKAISTNHRSTQRVWYWAAAIAAIISITIPIAKIQGNDSVKTINVGNTKAYFCCNNDCDAESSIEVLNSIIH